GATPVGFFPVAACRDVEVNIGNDDVTKYHAVIRIADPDHIRLARLPEKGKIAMHPVCDADITNTPGDPYKPYFDTASQLLTSLRSPSDAAKGAGKDNKGGGRGGTN